MSMKCNPFMLFANEFKSKPENVGLSLQEAISVVGPIWENMSQEQRFPYLKKSKVNSENKTRAKFTSQGVNIEFVKNKQEENGTFLLDMEKDIQLCCDSLSFEMDYFYVVHINNFCYCKATQRNYPAEIAIARFNLRNGVKISQVYHKICKPGKIPLGYTYTVQSHAARTHKLPIPDCEHNLHEIFTDIITILSYGKNNSNVLPPIYAEENNFDLVTSVMSMLCTDYGFAQHYIQVYSLNLLFFAMRNEASCRNNTQGFATTSLANMELEKDRFSFAPNIACEYHEMIDTPNFCSKSFVIRYIYYICQNSCFDLHIDLIPKYHIPGTSPDSNRSSNYDEDLEEELKDDDFMNFLDCLTENTTTLQNFHICPKNESENGSGESSSLVTEDCCNSGQSSSETSSVTNTLHCPCSNTRKQRRGRGGFYKFIGERQKFILNIMEEIKSVIKTERDTEYDNSIFSSTRNPHFNSESIVVKHENTDTSNDLFPSNIIDDDNLISFMEPCDSLSVLKKKKRRKSEFERKKASRRRKESERLRQQRRRAMQTEEEKEIVRAKNRHLKRVKRAAEKLILQQATLQTNVTSSDYFTEDSDLRISNFNNFHFNQTLEECILSSRSKAEILECALRDTRTAKDIEAEKARLAARKRELRAAMSVEEREFQKAKQKYAVRAKRSRNLNLCTANGYSAEFKLASGTTSDATLRNMQENIHNVCLPIKKLEDVWNYLLHPPEWSRRTIDLIPREFGVTIPDVLDCHVEEHNYKPQKRVDRSCMPRTLVCHDMKGGYLSDRHTVATRPGKDYVFYHWAYIDVFVYFSHNLITIPPLGWINVAHKNGVKILGTFITEWDDGKATCEEILFNKKKRMRFVEILVDICLLFRFDGWLLNIENPISNPASLLEFVKELTAEMHKKKPQSLVIWYDSVTCDGELKWQNELNLKNRCYFDACDGIFLNYTWTERHLLNTLAAAKHRILDVYVGLDVWGRNFIGGGKFNSHYAAQLIRKHNLSMAIFAQGWTHESLDTEPQHDFYYRFLQNDNTFWRSIRPYLYNHPISRYFTSTFYTGSDQHWYILENQELQLSSIPHCKDGLPGNETVSTLSNACSCLQLNVDGCATNNTSCRLTNEHLDGRAVYVHRLLNCDIHLDKDKNAVLHTVSKSDGAGASDNLTIVVLIQDINGTTKKVLCNATEHGDPNSGLSADMELYPLRNHRAIDFVKMYSHFNDNDSGWILRCYLFNHANLNHCRVLEVGAILKPSSSLLLGGIGIQRVFL